MRAGPLSDPRVIRQIQDNFIPFALNATTDGFPTDVMPGLSHFQSAYEKNWRLSFGFANCSVFDPSGRWPLGASGLTAAQVQLETGNDDRQEPETYLRFIDESLSRWQQLSSAQQKMAVGDFLGGGAELQKLLASVVSQAQLAGQAQHRQQTEWNQVAPLLAALPEANEECRTGTCPR